MNEELLHHIWKFKLFDLKDLFTTNSQRVEILKAGDHNLDSGPDFFNARVWIGGMLWAGNVEIHTNASDWQKHFHQNDKAYDNVILHVVYNADVEIKRRSGELIPTVELKSRIPKRVIYNYLNFRESKTWIPCEKQIGTVPSLIWQNTIDKMVLERLERKSLFIERKLNLNKNDWEETFYQLLARNFGFNKNAEPFELLAKSLPLQILSKHKTSRLQIEALLFGQAGMLEVHMNDRYALALQNEYAFLRHKYRLQPLDLHLWKFLRLRPVNFPGIRIAQFAQLIDRSSAMFSTMLAAEEKEKLEEMLDTSVSDYWETHYIFDKASAKRSKKLGAAAINNLIVNTVVPFLFVYGKHKGEEKYVERALRFLEQTAPEFNSVISGWQELKLPVANAYASQALLQLKNEYCTHKKCLVCNIGNYLIKNS